MKSGECSRRPAGTAQPENDSFHPLGIFTPIGEMESNLTSYGCFPQNRGKTPQIINLNRVFHYFHHPFWGTTIFGKTHIIFYKWG